MTGFGPMPRRWQNIRVRVLLIVIGAVLVCFGILTGSVLLANATLFSPTAFARDYLAALSTGRVNQVLDLPGVQTFRLDNRILNPAAMHPFSYSIEGIEKLDETYRVTVRFTSDGETGQATLFLEQIGFRFGVFPMWGFAESPITELNLRVIGDSHLLVGDLPLEISGGRASFAALTPSVYRLDHQSRFLTATPVFATVTGFPTQVIFRIEANKDFHSAVQVALNQALQNCAESRVLFPPGCPFGYRIENRVLSDPIWQIAEMPEVELVPSSEIFGAWEVSPAQGTAHLEVEVQTIFDGTVSMLSEDVPFEVAYRIAFDNGRIVVLPIQN